MRSRAQLWNARHLSLATYSLIAVNVAVFLIIGVSSPSTMGLNGGISHLHADLGLNKLLLQGHRLIFDGNAIRFSGAADGPHEWYRLITAGFLHFGIIHILFNMVLLYQLGQLLERPLGRSRFLLLYFAAMLAGSLGSLLVDNQLAIAGGASGAVFGLMAAAAVGLHRRGVNVFTTGIGTTLLLNIVLTFSIRGISIGAHTGGAIAGAICGYVMLAPTWKPYPKWAAWAAPAAVAIASVAASAMIAMG